MEGFESLLDDGMDALDALPSFLDSPAPQAQLIKVVQLEAGEVDPRLKRMSYSSRLDLHACNRKFQLNRLQATKPPQDDSTSVTFAFGHALGEGIQQYLLARSNDHKSPLDHAIWAAFRAWDVDLWLENLKQNKSFGLCVAALMQFDNLCKEGTLGREYEVAYFEGKPAAELSFSIDLGDGFKYRGYVDLVLRNKHTGEYLILELKTSSANYVKPATYKNSAQAIGYSVVLDKIAPGTTSYAVQYLVYMTKLSRYEAFDFPKTFNQRVQWIQHLIWDKKVITDLVAFYGNDGVWQTMGESCLAFGRECDYMDLCTSATHRLTTKLTETDLVEEPEYQFNFTLQELLS